MALEFTSDWVSNKAESWLKTLGHLKERVAHGLELGSYEGRSAIWFCEHILTHEHSRLTCVDGFWPRYSPRFIHNIAEAGIFGKLDIRRGDTHTIARSLTGPYDFAYIDADHRGHAVITDACLVWPLLKKGGVLIFDDYLLKMEPPTYKETDVPCKEGIDAFLACFAGQYEVLHKGWQVIVRKV